MESQLLLRHQKDEVRQTPQDERPIRSVPDSRQEPYHEEIEDMPCFRFHPVSAQRNVDIIPEPAGQGDMPTPPELRNGTGNIRIVEVFIEVKPEHLSQTDGHIRISAEIEINLEGVGQCSQPGHSCRQRHIPAEPLHRSVSEPKGMIRNQCHVIGQKHLLAQPDNKPHHTVGKILHVLLSVVDLIRNGLIPHNRSGDELRKEGDVQAHIQQILLGLPPSPVHVDYIGDCLKRKKRNSDWQSDFRHLPVCVKYQVQVFHRKRQVFVYENNQQIDENVQCNQPPYIFVCFMLSNQQPKEPVHQNGCHHHQYESRFSPGIEKQTGQAQKYILRPPAELKSVIYKQYYRQVDKYEYVT